jgi:hypothetical protein
MTRAVKHNDRFLVERNDEPAVLILSVADHVKTLAPAPDWLNASWYSAKRHGLDKLTPKEIDSEIAASRRQPHLKFGLRDRSKALQMPVHQRERQSHDIEVTPLYGIDELGGQPLNRIRSGFVHRLAA